MNENKRRKTNPERKCVLKLPEKAEKTRVQQKKGSRRRFLILKYLISSNEIRAAKKIKTDVARRFTHKV
jgi:hypothetical protein